MITLAIDPGISATGVAVFKNTKLLHITTIRPKLEGDSRLRELALAVLEVTIKFKPDLFAIESQYITAGYGHQLTLPELKGVLIGAFISAMPESKICSVYPNSILSTLGVKGKLHRKQKKEVTKNRIQLLYPELTTKRISADAYDAIAIGLTAMTKGRKY